MVEPTYISGGKAWLSPAEPAEGAPVPPTSDAVAPRLCLGCGDPLPPIRKSFHNKSCQGRFLHGTREAARKAAAKEKE